MKRILSTETLVLALLIIFGSLVPFWLAVVHLREPLRPWVTGATLVLPALLLLYICGLLNDKKRMTTEIAFLNVILLKIQAEDDLGMIDFEEAIDSISQKEIFCNHPPDHLLLEMLKSKYKISFEDY